MPEALIDAASAGRKCGLRDAGLFLKIHLGYCFEHAQNLGKVLSRSAQADARGATQVLDRGGQAAARGSCLSQVLRVDIIFN